jgi:hypothetical protein
MKHKEDALKRIAMMSKDWPFLRGSRYLIIPQDFLGDAGNA